MCVCEIETGNWLLKWRPRKHANYSLSCWAGHPGEWTEGSRRGDHSRHQKEGNFFPAQRFFGVCGMKSWEKLFAWYILYVGGVDGHHKYFFWQKWSYNKCGDSFGFPGCFSTSGSLTPDGSARGGGTQDHRLSCGGWVAAAQRMLPEAKDAWGDGLHIWAISTFRDFVY